MNGLYQKLAFVVILYHSNLTLIRSDNVFSVRYLSFNRMLMFGTDNVVVLQLDKRDSDN